MYYRSYRRFYHPKSYNHPKRKMTDDFLPILLDLRKCFFSLTEKQKRKFFNKYKIKYGESAFNYAITMYDKWKNGQTDLSSKTLLRLVEILPECIESEVKVELFKKLVIYHKKKCQVIFRKEKWNWNNYNQSYNEFLMFIKKNYSIGIERVLQCYQLPETILNVAKWISSDDIKVVEYILRESIISDYERMIKAAFNDIKLFKQKLDILNSMKDIYNTVSINIDLPVLKVNIVVPAKELTLVQKIKNLF